MKLQSAVLAKFAEVDRDGLLQMMGGGLSVFGVSVLPATFTVAVVVQLRFEESEADQPRQVRFVVRDAELVVVGEPAEVEIVPRLGPHHAPGWQGSFTLTGALELIVERSGPHNVSIEIDGAFAGDIPFQVLHVP